MSKLPNNFTTDQLLAELNKNQDSSEILVPEQKNDVLAFLMFYDLKPGEFKVERRILCDLYSRWSVDPLSSQRVSNTIGRYLPVAGRWFSINKEAFTLSDKAFQLLQKNLQPSQKKPKSRNYKLHFDSFLNHFTIKDGNLWLESYILYYLYDKWVFDTKKTNPLGEKPFKAFLDLTLETKRRTSKRTETIHWYKVDRSILTFLPEDHINQIRQGRNNARKEKKPKKSSKTPSP